MSCEEDLSWGGLSGHNPSYQGTKTCGLSGELNDGCNVQALHDDGRIKTTPVKREHNGMHNGIQLRKPLKKGAKG